MRRLVAATTGRAEPAAALAAAVPATAARRSTQAFLQYRHTPLDKFRVMILTVGNHVDVFG